MSSSFSFSKRAESLLDNQRHSKTSFQDETWSWDFTLKESESFLGDKILTLMYSNLPTERSDSLFLETISILSIEKNIDFLIRLGFREVENYLRDENHRPAFDAKDEISLEKSFKKVKNSLLSALILNKLKETKDKYRQNISWNDLSFVEKNRRVMAILEDLNLLFPKGKKASLALVENETIFLVKNDLPLDLDTVELILRPLFHIDSGKSSLKVVAAL